MLSGFFSSMKKTVLIFLLISTLGYSQNMSVGNQKLLSELTRKEEKRRDRITSYLNAQPAKEKSFKRGQKDYEIFDIVDDKPIYIATDNLNSAKGTKTIALQPGGSLNLSLTGEGYTIGVWDSGVAESTHQEFTTDEVSKIEPEASKEAKDHATHVTGTIAALGTNSAAVGMARSAKIKSFDWTNDKSELVTAANDNEKPIYFSNHSYGFPIYNDDGEQNVSAENIGAYTSSARDWDNIAFQNKNLLIVGSAGNEGTTSYEGGMFPNYDKLTGTKTAKNSLVVANANPDFHPLTQQLTGFPINNGSSQGPTDDLRVKPDIAGDGTNVFSSINNNDYTNYSGTSMASPNVCGSLVLLHQHYVNLFNQVPKSATLKAIACHTAVDDEATVGPDPKFGWGLLDAKAAAELITAKSNGNAFIEEKILNQNESFSTTITANGTAKLTVSICWIDPPGPIFNNGANDQTPVLMNDLDVKVEKNGVTYYPWKLTLNETGFSNEHGNNVVDNYEKIEIENPEAGTFTITVSHKGNLTNPDLAPLVFPKYQEYSIVVSGDNINFPLSNKKIFASHIGIYPNPVENGIISILGLENNLPIEIRNTLGQIVWTGVSSNKIDVSRLTSGLYFLKVLNQGKTGSFIVQN